MDLKQKLKFIKEPSNPLSLKLHGKEKGSVWDKKQIYLP